MKRTLAGLAVSTLALSGMLVATAAPASAHDQTVSATCDALTVDLWAYGGADVTVTVDDQVVAAESFDSTWSFPGGTYALDPASPHTWSVDVDAHDDARYDVQKTGETAACPGSDDEGLEVGLYLYEKEDENLPAGWHNSGDQELVAHRESNEFWDEFPGELPTDVCGPGWAVQQDVVRPDGDFTWPTTIERQVPTLWTWLQGAKHQDLDELVDVPECGPETPQAVELPAPTPVEECGPQDSVTLPTSEYATYSEKWSDDRSSVVVTATARDGVTLAQNATTEWTFTFDTAACDVELPVATPAVPQVTDLCGVQNDTLGLPTDGENVTYASTAEGVVATAAEGYTLGGLPEGYTSTGATTALYAATAETFTDVDCELVPGDIAAVCQGDVPYLGYEVGLPEGIEVSDETPLTVTFVNPDGEDYVATDQPLAGSLLWPGASDTEPLQWPGWEQQADGSYVETDGNYAWTRDGVQVRFEVNPDYSTVVDYPAASTECANPPAAVGGEVAAGPADGGPELAATGATVGWAAGIAALLVGGGVTLFWLRRRMQQH